MTWKNSAYLFLTFIIFIISFTTANAQKQDVFIGKEYNNLSWEEFVKQIEKDKNIRIFYLKSDIQELTINNSSEKISLVSFLRKNLKEKNLYVNKDSCNYFITKDFPVRTSIKENFFDEVVIDTAPIVSPEKDTKYLDTRDEFYGQKIIIGKNQVQSKSKYNINGYIKCAEDGEPLVGGTVYIKELGIGTVTSSNGYYTLSLPPGNYTLQASSIERKEKKFFIEVRGDGKLDIQLEKKLISLEEIVVRSDKYDNVKSTHMGLERLSIKEIDEIPQVMGEKDIVKIALMLPGVQNTGEGSSGFNVRGSPSDQTLFYINDVPVYNTSHLLGFFSAFNPDAISEFKLYKSNIPIEHGGRLSSVFDISTIQGDRKKFTARGGISPLTGRIFVESPVIKDKSSFFVGARSTYSDWLLDLMESPDIRQSDFYFGDLMGSFSYDLGARDKFKIFGYYSKDDIGFSKLADYSYQNQGASFNWQHLIGNNSKFTLSAIFSDYGFEERNQEIDIEAYQHDFNIKNYKINALFNTQLGNKHTVVAGVKSGLYDLFKGQHRPLNTESLIITQNLGNEKALESSAFISDEWEIFQNLTLYGGLRYNLYNYLGAQDIYNYQQGFPKNISHIKDTLHFGNNEIIKTYHSPDLRLALNWVIRPGLSIKMSYNQLHQYIFMLSNTITISPTAKWKLADYHIEPLSGDQYSAGVYTTIYSSGLELSLEGYYKKVQNLVEYKNGADLLVNPVPETDVVQGNLDAWGLEFMLRKRQGRLNGWFNYTYSNALVKVDSPFAENKINFGEPYPANYDKPHAINLVANYKFSRRFSISGNVVYSTGRPVTYPVSIYHQDDKSLINYSLRNEYRLPDYFRIDVSINIEGNLKKRKLAHGSWMLSVYNLTGRKNAYSVYFRSREGQIKGYKMSIFGTPIITLTYNFKLGNYAS